jgi:hypothetical protein
LKANEAEDDHPAARRIVLERELASIRQGLAKFAPDVRASACTSIETAAP